MLWCSGYGHLPVTQPAIWDTNLNPGSSTSDSSSCYCAWEGSRRWPQACGAVHLCGKLGRSSWLLGSAYPSSCYYDHLDSEPMSGKLSRSVSFCNFAFKVNECFVYSIFLKEKMTFCSFMPCEAG